MDLPQHDIPDTPAQRARDRKRLLRAFNLSLASVLLICVVFFAQADFDFRAFSVMPHSMAGLHFFNPVPVMKLEEVVAGLKTDPALCTALAAQVRQMGHTAVQAQDNPGFIVNLAGRALTT
mgnify:CR=1 FL=1